MKLLNWFERTFVFNDNLFMVFGSALVFGMAVGFVGTTFLMWLLG